MYCPHCHQNSFNFNRVYFWPVGTKVCPACGGTVRQKRDWRLNIASIFLSAAAFIPTLLTADFWYLIPGITIAMALDYLMDRRFRLLEPAAGQQPAEH